MAAPLKPHELTLEEIAKHNTKESCWFILEGKVLDVTPFLASHPGGATILLKNGGKDASRMFESVGHSTYALNEAKKYEIGSVVGPKSRL